MLARASWFAVLLLLCGETAAMAGGSSQPAPDRLEPGLIPILAGDSDVGVGLGAVGSLARFRPRCDQPYCWRLEALLYFTIKRHDDAIELPYHDYYLKLDLPGLIGGALRLYLQIGFGRYANAGYYGLGNAAAGFESKSSLYHEYDRIDPQLQARARVTLLRNLSLVLGASVVYNWINLYWTRLHEPSPTMNLYEPSKLVQDIRAREVDPVLRDLLHGTSSHLLGELIFGCIWESRDHETVPSRGQFHEISWRSGLAPGSDVAYGGLNLTLRVYRGLVRDRLSLAFRLMGDLLFGAPPFYELARSGGLSPSGAVGGGAAIRGVPLHRYHGKAKLLSNLELRARFVSFRIRSQRFNVGAIAFADAGRLWADYRSQPTLDGSGLGLKVGLGGGLRVQWGETFLLRADLAWSPDASPVGLYVDVGHAF